MAERTRGIYSLITLPYFYKTFQNILGGNDARKEFSVKYFKRFRGKRILEVGCGPGTWVPELSMADFYMGVDWNSSHIENAKKKYETTSVQFDCGDVSKYVTGHNKSFDVVCAFGLLHHLDDNHVESLMTTVSQVLVNDGIFLAIEPVYHENQNWFSRWMKNRDSGQNIRKEHTYKKLLENHFSDVESYIHTDMLRIPYSHCVLTAKLL